ncbi:MAG: T9SS type A sorting domain-containing protein, partial [Bacteroidetes bacterium]|nr:T9SS type A sorting domain-containing protein [Bacteroidota bacterium]
PMKRPSFPGTMLPDSFTNYIKLKVNTWRDSLLHIALYDCSGKTVKMQQNRLQPGDNYILIAGLQSLAKGIYILKMEDGMEAMQRRLIK